VSDLSANFYERSELAVDQAEARRIYYEGSGAVQHFDGRYSPAKERAFCSFLARFLDPKSRVIEIGGGTGFHAAILQQITGADYIHSDYSGAMCASARRRGLRSIQLDALDLSDIEGVDQILSVELSTLRTEDGDVRQRQYNEFARALVPGGRLVISLASYSAGGLHGFDASDLNMARRAGFKIEARHKWGLIPSRLWSTPLALIAPAMERWFGMFRTVVVLRRV
jgi:SAM-dependent methyltransferase